MDRSLPSPITPQAWRRLLEAFDVGAKPELACRYAGISLATWQAECERIREFKTEAEKVDASTYVAVLRLLLGAAASEWRAGVEYLKTTRPELFGTTRTREV